ncbi:MAG: polyprenyl synthetase family protein [Gammaproteobacteria bacterium]|nr:polyprenyl synthetase family protein [Gammaproteobacteria bacterium]
MAFEKKVAYYTERVSSCLDRALPPVERTPERLHEAMRYAVLNGGKRIRPLLIYATGECLGVDEARLDPAAVAIELIHAFSLVHDDLPAMDDDDLRRGMPTVHRQYDEATAILAADALQPLAFTVLSTAESLNDREKVSIIGIIGEACGSLGMTGGQSIDLASEGRAISEQDLQLMHGLKTGALIRASVMSACCLANGISDARSAALRHFSECLGLAFQIRDDILDVEGNTDVIGKQAGADLKKSKATWPALFGIEESRRRCAELLDAGLASLEVYGKSADPLRWLARYIVDRPM